MSAWLWLLAGLKVRKGVPLVSAEGLKAAAAAKAATYNREQIGKMFGIGQKTYFASSYPNMCFLWTFVFVPWESRFDYTMDTISNLYIQVDIIFNYTVHFYSVCTETMPLGEWSKCLLG